VSRDFSLRKVTMENNQLKILFTISCLLCGLVAMSQNLSNKGKEFWTGYGHHQFFTSPRGNGEKMILYLSAEEPARVTVSINGTSWTRTYDIPANTVVPTDILPKSGPDDPRLLTEGISDRGIHIVSDTPIVAYAHIYGETSSGATMLLPVETYGYNYVSLNSDQAYAADCYSWFFVVASGDNTKVRITPSQLTVGGKARNVPFEVSLMKGQIYNVMAAIRFSTFGFDATGSKIESIEGADGKCHPVAVFSGSSRTNICTPEPFGGGGDNIIQQVFPASAWGNRYLTAPTSSVRGAGVLNNGRIRILVKDRATVVMRNGVRLTSLIANSYYDFLSTGPEYITSDMPVMVAQFMPSGTGCGTTEGGDPEMFYLSPMEQAIKKTTFYNTNKEQITNNYITLIVPENGLRSLKIDGSSAFDTSYAHPGLAGYRVVVKALPAVDMQHTAQCDSGFTAITYGLGFAESYGYNAGTNINNLDTKIEFKNNNGAGTTDYTCPNTVFNPVIKTMFKPTSILWQMSKVKGIQPAKDTTTAGAPIGTVTENGRVYNLYPLPGNYTFSDTGLFQIPFSITDAAAIENCSKTQSFILPVRVIKGPAADFTKSAMVCTRNTISFNGLSPDAVNKWSWDFGDLSRDSVQNVLKVYQRDGKFNVKLQVTRVDGCVGDTTKPVEIRSTPRAKFDLPEKVCMPGGAGFTNQSDGYNGPGPVTYAWDFGDGAVSNAPRPYHVYSAVSAYTVTLKVSTPEGCADSISKVFSTFADKPVAIFFTPDTLCQNTRLVFADSTVGGVGGTIVKWMWLFGDGTSSAAAIGSKLYNAPGVYTISHAVTNAAGCVSDTVQQTINIAKVPRVDAGPAVITSSTEAVILRGSVDDATATVRWSPPAYLSNANILTPSVKPLQTQLYYLTATSAGYCSATDSVLISVQNKVQIPNAFSPNGDGINDTWIMPGLQNYARASVEIFNRYGQVVFRSTGYTKPWDGTMNGNPLPVGVYYYIVVPLDAQDKLYGSVTLMR
jgi:gliding motility-associated-like protein